MSATGYPFQMAGGVPVVTAPTEIDATTVGQLRVILLKWHAHGARHSGGGHDWHSVLRFGGAEGAGAGAQGLPVGGRTPAGGCAAGVRRTGAAGSRRPSRDCRRPLTPSGRAISPAARTCDRAALIRGVRGIPLTSQDAPAMPGPPDHSALSFGLRLTNQPGSRACPSSVPAVRGDSSRADRPAPGPAGVCLVGPLVSPPRCSQADAARAALPLVRRAGRSTVHAASPSARTRRESAAHRRRRPVPDHRDGEVIVG